MLYVGLDLSRQRLDVHVLVGTSGRELLAGFELPEPWATTLATSLAMLDELDERIAEPGESSPRSVPTTPTSRCC
jgi:hypothetical protein